MKKREYIIKVINKIYDGIVTMHIIDFSYTGVQRMKKEMIIELLAGFFWLLTGDDISSLCPPQCVIDFFKKKKK